MKRKKNPSDCSLFIFNHSSFLGHVNAVQEFTDILVADLAGLVDAGGGLGHLLDVVALHHELVLEGL